VYNRLEWVKSLFGKSWQAFFRYGSHIHSNIFSFPKYVMDYLANNHKNWEK
jgi:hypothetical protein